ncbi:MAG TPA: glycosyltransferase family 4 protein [Rickettsiales bacterium]|nr:glycosyltransferase family 4 protein [Rickettsiales bacterium]
MRKLRLVNVMLSTGHGGIEQALLDYSEAARLAGHDAYAVIHPEAEVTNGLVSLAIHYQALSDWGAWDIFAARKLRKMLEVWQADICIAHGNRALSLARHMPKGCRLVTVMHNYNIKCANAEAILCPTNDLCNFVQSQHIPKKRIFHVPNMVRVQAEYASHPRSTPPVIGAMGRFVEKKGFDVLIESLALLKKRDVAFRAVLAGDGEEEASLKALASARGVDNMISFPGWITQKQPFFEAIDLFCLPSRHEPFGIALLEAMTQGLPVIAADSEGPGEIITNGIDGMLVEKGDPAMLADCIEQLLADPAEAALLARNAYDTVKKKYDLPVASNKISAALETVAAGLHL